MFVCPAPFGVDPEVLYDIKLSLTNCLVLGMESE